MLGNLITYLTGKPPYMSPGQCEAFVDAIVYAMMADKVVDPDEMKNLAMDEKHQEILKEYRAKAVAELKRTEAPFVDVMPKASTMR